MPSNSAFIDSMRDACVAFFAEQALEEAPPSPISFPDPEWGFADFGNACFIFKRPETKAAVDKLRSKFFRVEWTAKWSNSHISRKFGEAMNAVTDPHDAASIRLLMEAAANSLDEEPSTFRVLFVVGGVHAIDEIQLGPGARLFKMDDVEYGRLLTGFTGNAANPHSPEAIASHRRQLSRGRQPRTQNLRSRDPGHASGIDDSDRRRILNARVAPKRVPIR